MKNEDEMIAAFRVLWKNAENDFERHRIESLVRDLVEPPKVEIIDDTHVVFDGLKFRKTNNNKYKTDDMLHRYIYRYYNGEIPPGFEIHHIDNNPENNDISNLACLTKAEHTKVHFETNTGRFARREMTCEMCGQKFIARYHGNNRFCSEKCKQMARRIECREIRICAYCGKPFEIENYEKVTHCSVACERKDRHKNAYEEKICPVCGKKFTVKKKFHQKYCSTKCAHKYLAAQGHIKKHCLNCGKKFDSLKSHNAKYCSRSCFQEHRKNHSTKTTLA